MKNKNLYVAIMAGGVGSRFWPGSREARPKQFLDILGIGKSLLQMTFERFLSLCPKENIYIVTNSSYQEQILDQIPQISSNQVLCEPSRNNTAPSIAYAGLKFHSLNPESVFVVAPSDHIIMDQAGFHRIVQEGVEFCSQSDSLMTLGIEPTRPDTGYGYIHFDKNKETGNVHKVHKFTEKPQLETAKSFLASGDYLWNAGIFIWRTSALLKAFETNTPEILEKLNPVIPHLNSKEEQNVINKYYPDTPNISVDYAILEKAKNVYTIPSSFGWSDLGTWASLHQEVKKDSKGNSLFGKYFELNNCSNNLIRLSDNKLAVIDSLDDFIVVDEDDVLLIYPKGKEQEIKKITSELRAKNLSQFL